jgi:hypothetical protein
LQALPIFLDKLVDPVTAVLLSVSVVLVIGEILPQAVCRSYGLQVGSYSALFVRLLLFLAAPISWPIGKVLDWLLGGEQTVSTTLLAAGGGHIYTIYGCHLCGLDLRLILCLVLLRYHICCDGAVAARHADEGSSSPHPEQTCCP